MCMCVRVRVKVGIACSTCLRRVWGFLCSKHSSFFARRAEYPGLGSGGQWTRDQSIKQFWLLRVFPPSDEGLFAAFTRRSLPSRWSGGLALWQLGQLWYFLWLILGCMDFDGFFMPDMCTKIERVAFQYSIVVTRNARVASSRWTALISMTERSGSGFTTLSDRQCLRLRSGKRHVGAREVLRFCYAQSRMWIYTGKGVAFFSRSRACQKGLPHVWGDSS